MRHSRKIARVLVGTAVVAVLTGAYYAWASESREPVPSDTATATRVVPASSLSPGPVSRPATASAIATIASLPKEYNMDFTLPTIGKSGCMVCHGDRNLIRQKGRQAVSFYIDPAITAGSAHASVQCTGCHVDFAYKAPHKQADDWRTTARLACKNCHQKQYLDYSGGVHGSGTRPGEKATNQPLPLCGDCHGSHDIKILTQAGAKAAGVEYDPAGKRELHKKGAEVCGKCHEDFWASYNDYYHGAAYLRGAPDAPACWDCHGAHDIFKSKDPRSMVNATRIVVTCSQCHQGVLEKYPAEYAQLIHNRQEIEQANPVYSVLIQARTGFSQAIRGVFSLFR